MRNGIPAGAMAMNTRNRISARMHQQPLPQASAEVFPSAPDESAGPGWRPAQTAPPTTLACRGTCHQQAGHIGTGDHQYREHSTQKQPCHESHIVYLPVAYRSHREMYFFAERSRGKT